MWNVSFLAISMFTIKCWFVVLSQINVSTSLSVLRGSCVSIEVILKSFSTWMLGLMLLLQLNEQYTFSKESISIKKKVNILPDESFLSYHSASSVLLCMNSCIADCSYMKQEQTRLVKARQSDMSHISLIILLLSKIYNTTILFFHLVAPFHANLFSALFIIFGAVRQR